MNTKKGLDRMAFDGTRRKKQRLGDMLVAANVITQEQLEQALVEQKQTENSKLGEVLIDLGYTNELDIARALHVQLDFDIVNLSDIKIEEDILNLVSDTICRKNMLIPFAISETNPNMLRVAMSNPLDIIAIDDVIITTNMQVEPVVTTHTDVAAALDKYFGNAEAMAVAARFSAERQGMYDEETAQVLNEEIENSPIVKLVRQMMEQAVRQRASDIHIEPMENKVRIRFRIDGVLKEIVVYSLSLLSAIVARIKIIGGMDIAEKRKPQDGRITITVDRKEFDIRASILPTVFGEKVVMRLTSKQGLTKDKKELGFTDDELKSFDNILSHPHGIILVTGPTGSGKSTTLYTALSELNRDDVNIITVEDPVEANIDGINQVQVNTKAGLTFASALRSILRQDPDIIMIGEIRDEETAQIAVKAAITGHLVVSTLHTNSAASSVTRLADMGLEHYLIGDALVGAIAQRLVRRLCPACKKAKHATEIEKQLLGVDVRRDITIYEPIGCNSCDQTGYRGRIGIYEIMKITTDLKIAIAKKANADQLQKLAIAHGMHTLRMSAANCVLSGVTSINEMNRIALD